MLPQVPAPHDPSFEGGLLRALGGGGATGAAAPGVALEADAAGTAVADDAADGAAAAGGEADTDGSAALFPPHEPPHEPEPIEPHEACPGIAAASAFTPGLAPHEPVAAGGVAAPPQAAIHPVLSATPSTLIKRWIVMGTSPSAAEVT